MIRKVDGVTVYTYKKTIQHFNSLEVEVGTTGLCGGDGGHGGRTYFALKDLGSTSISGRTRVDQYGCTNIEITLAGDSELRTLVEALEYAVSTLKNRLKEENVEKNEKVGSSNLFSYYESQKFVNSIKVKIGRFMSKTILWFNDNKALQGIGYVNKINRYELAKIFLESNPDICKADISEEILLEDIAQYIDLKIPLHYWIYLQKAIYGDSLKYNDYVSSYDGIQTIPGLVFRYSVNYELEPKLLYSK